MSNILILTAPIWISCLSAAVFYKLFSKNTRPEIRYYFSKELFDRHIREKTISNSGFRRQIINNREEMSMLWDKEMKYKLP